MMSKLRVIFLDAAGTLFHLSESVGQTYASHALKYGIHVEPLALTEAFKHTWKNLPPPEHPAGARADDDDRAWWEEMVRCTYKQALGQAIPEQVFKELFNELYAYFAKPEAWQLYPETVDALQLLYPRYTLYVLSNFDRRLHSILEGLHISTFFKEVILSSDVGVSKPHPRIFEHALSVASVSACECLHIGDDIQADHHGAQSLGIPAVHLERPVIDLLQIAKKC